MSNPGCGRTQRRSCESEYGIRRSVDWRLGDEPGINGIEIVRAVDQEIVRFGALAVHSVALALSNGAAGLHETGRERCDAGLQESKLRKIAAVERKIEQLAFADYLPMLVTVG